LAAAGFETTLAEASRFPGTCQQFSKIAVDIHFGYESASVTAVTTVKSGDQVADVKRQFDLPK
jgi:hypothetical protein